MDQAIMEFLNRGTFILAVLVVILNFFIRRTVELLHPDFKPLAGTMDKKAMYSNRAAMWWNEIGLYALPVLIGANLGLVKGLAFLFDASIKTTSGRVFFAGIVGWFADFLYEVIQKILYKNTGVSLPSPMAGGNEVVVVHEERHEEKHHETPAAVVTTTTVTVKSPEPPPTVEVPAATPAPATSVVVVEVPPGPTPTALGGGVDDKEG